MNCFQIDHSILLPQYAGNTVSVSHSFVLGSTPKRGQNPVEWEKILFVRLSICPPMAALQTPPASPQTLLAGPQTSQTLQVGPQTPAAGPPLSPLAGP